MLEDASYRALTLDRLKGIFKARIGCVEFTDLIKRIGTQCFVKGFDLGKPFAHVCCAISGKQGWHCDHCFPWRGSLPLSARLSSAKYSLSGNQRRHFISRVKRLGK